MEEENGSWFVYIIQEAGTGHIKVGYGKNPGNRLRGKNNGALLQWLHPLQRLLILEY